MGLGVRNDDDGDGDGDDDGAGLIVDSGRGFIGVRCDGVSSSTVSTAIAINEKRRLRTIFGC